MRWQEQANQIAVKNFKNDDDDVPKGREPNSRFQILAAYRQIRDGYKVSIL
jgi:hypothetical protein